MTAWQLLSNALPGVWQSRVLWATVGLGLLVFFGAVVIVWADRWRKQANTPVLTPKDQLAQFRELYERGELSQEEFDRIQARLQSEKRERSIVPPPGGPNGSPAADKPTTPDA